MRFDVQKAAAGALFLLSGGVLIFLFCRTVLPLLLPFLLAFALALATRPLCVRLTQRTRCPLRVSALLVTLLALFLLALFLLVICNRLALELQRLLELIIADSQKPDGELAGVISFFRGISQHLPFLSALESSPLLSGWLGDPQSYLSAQLQHFLEGAAGRIAALAAGLLRRLPGVLLFLLVFLISAFYFAVEYGTVTRAICRLLPARWRERLPVLRDRLAGGVKRCCRAYFLLFLFTFAQLALGFLLLSVRAPLLLALFAAFLDILPVLGVGVVLLPMAVFALITGKVGQGIGLLFLYGVITVLRQITEPRLVGKSLGVHPLLLLVCFYVGIRAFGVLGLLLGPLAALLITELCKRAPTRE